MFEVQITEGGRVHRHVIDNLPLPSGVLAHTLDQAALWRELRPLKLPNVTVTTGRQDMLVAYSKYLKANTIDVATGKTPPEAA